MRNSLYFWSIALSFSAFQADAETALTVTGSDASGAPIIIEYTIDELRNMDQTNYLTINDFVDVPTEFSGPLLREVIEPLTVARDSILQMTALNDYQIDIPVSDAEDYEVLVAIEKDGTPMSIRENGPLWIIYPMSQHKELQAPLYNSRLIWQLTTVDVR